MPTIIVYQADSFLGSETLKNQVQNMDLKKQGAKNRVIVIQKEKKPGCLFSFLQVFCNLLLSAPYFGLDFFQGHKPTHVFKTSTVGAD